MTREAELYEFVRSCRVGVVWQLGEQDADDLLHDAFVIAVEASRQKSIPNLKGYTFVTIRNKTAQAIHRRRFVRTYQCNDALPELLTGEESAEQKVLAAELRTLLARAMQRLIPGYRDLLVRFYFLEQPRAQIMSEMKLDDTQYRLTKSRAQIRLGEIAARLSTLYSAPAHSIQAKQP